MHHRLLVVPGHRDGQLGGGGGPPGPVDRAQQQVPVAGPQRQRGRPRAQRPGPLRELRRDLGVLVRGRRGGPRGDGTGERQLAEAAGREQQGGAPGEAAAAGGVRAAQSRITPATGMALTLS
nr:hypothetical protein KPHV_26280 [Kitasatospora purpeofusca]